VHTPCSPLLRDATLLRDFDAEQRLSYCVFCGLCRDPSQLQAAHLIPNSVSERYGLEVPGYLQGVIGGYYETTLNAVAACTLCHPIFDRGFLWAEPVSSPVAAESAPATAGTATLPWQSVQVGELILQVDASQRCEHSSSLRGRRLRLPGAERALLPFPVAPVWEWRRRWAPLRSEDELARQMGKLGLSGPCERMDACQSNTRLRNKNCARRMCLQCCLAAQGPPACKVKEHQARPASSG
jgi:hypothetical protein